MNKSFRSPLKLKLTKEQQELKQKEEEMQKSIILTEIKRIKKFNSTLKDSDDEKNEDGDRFAFINKLQQQIHILQQRMSVMEQTAKSDKSLLNQIEDVKKKLNAKIERKLKLLIETREKQQSVDSY